MTLVEATVILAVASMLTAILAPSVRSYVQSAQQAAAKRDVETIGSAIARMLNDVGETAILRNGQETATTDPTNVHAAPDHATGNLVHLLVSEGNTPAVWATVARAVGTDWDDPVCSCPGTPTAIQKLEWFLAVNTPNNTSANGYRTASEMSANFGFDPDDANTFNSEHAWRGAYMPGPIGPDPWGNRYGVNVEFFHRATGTGQGQVNDVFVLSAGNNGLVETAFNVDGVTNANDVVYVVSGGTR